MNNHSGDQKRLAKNTLMLYIRMIFIMLVSLYTTRVVLNVLGETDYGIYNIVGSVVVSAIFIQNALMSATQRFLSYELGLKEEGCVNTVFSSSMNLHLKFLIIIVVVLETVGLWFLNHVLSIPPERITAANIVYQFSIFTFSLNLIRIPYNAIIISYESMNIYAALSIVETALRLTIVIALKYLFSDKLVAYGILVFVITLIINTLYVRYCRKNYSKDTCFSIHGDKHMERKIRSFLGWNLLGGVAGVATQEGPNYFMNYYMGVTVNAAMGIAKQVSSAIYQFSANFQSAFNPQIVKAYASGENEYLFGLINRTSLFSFYLLFIFAFPILLCSDFILELWLENVPEYTVGLCVLLIIGQLITALASPLWMVAFATGDIKEYQIVLCSLNLLILPASYVVLRFGYSVYYVLIFQIFLKVLIYIYRLWFIRRKLGFPILKYIMSVILKCAGLAVLIIPIPVILSIRASGLWQNLAVMALSMLISIVVFFFLGLNKETQEMIFNFIRNKLQMLKSS